MKRKHIATMDSKENQKHTTENCLNEILAFCKAVARIDYSLDVEEYLDLMEELKAWNILVRRCARSLAR